ncbi:hypothetical protein [Serinicoccus sp. CUA-874]|uniref:AMIN-like domain-containing (lipo)protein n=1 Tax=Serinicoccus sp. CUA-874 TaxID=1517939 RepID=UPI000A91E8D9|nr:hypothetical protein [Serinicoccus sp. CUA-874]
MRTTPRALLASALLAGLALAPVTLAAPAATAAPYCGITWGSLPKVTGYDTEPAPLTDVRAGRHSCFDRVVLDVSGDAGEYSVRYVSTYRAPGSGQALSLRGGAKIEVVVGNPTYDATATRSTTRAPGRAGRHRRLPHAAPGAPRRELRGPDLDRARGAGAAAHAGLRARRPRVGSAAGHRRRPPLVSTPLPAGSSAVGLLVPAGG